MAENTDPFCEISDRPVSPFDIKQLVGASDVSLMPTVGMMMPGYFLAAPNEHVTSFAQLEPARLEQIDTELTDHEAFLGERFGDYFRVEHGSDSVLSCGSGGCLDHAHIHLIPDTEVAVQVQHALPWEQLDSYADLADFRGSPYIYLGRLGTHFVVPEPALPGQWIRRQIAKVKGLDEWDWAVDRGDKNLLATFIALRWFPSGSQISVDPTGLLTLKWQDKHYPDIGDTIPPDLGFSTPKVRTIYW